MMNKNRIKLQEGGKSHNITYVHAMFSLNTLQSHWV